jgi:hypothetical protein
MLRHAAWVTAEAALLQAAREGSGIVALLGAPGVGKTLMLGYLHRSLGEAGIPAQRLDFGDLAGFAEAAPVLLVDEADRMDDATLAALAERQTGVAVLAALPGFATRLEAVPHRVVRLPGLRAEDVEDYVAMRLAALDVPAARLQPEAISVLGLESAGVPRLLNVLIGSSLFTAGLEKAEAVSAEHVRSAANMHALSEVRLRAAEPTRRPAAPKPPATVQARPPQQAVVTLPTEPAPHSRDPADAPAAADAEPRRRGSGLLPWLAAGAVLGLIGAASAWLMLGPGSGGSVRGGDREVATLARATPAPAQTAAAEAAPPPDPAPAEAPPVLPALPVAPPARIVLTYPRGDAAAAARGDALAALLRGAGRSVAAPFPVAATVGEEVLRYFFLEDRDMALAIGARSGQAPQAHRLGVVPDAAPLPRPGTMEWALPAAGGARLARDVAPPERAALVAPEPVAPPTGSRLAVARLPHGMELRWQATEARAASPCCFVEVMGLEDDAWQEVFSGYALQADRHSVPLTAARPYAWRVTLVSRDGPRYAAGRWSHFTLTQAAE